METSELRALVKAAAVGTPGAKLWPNGLGFDCRGVRYTYAERGGDQWPRGAPCWVAVSDRYRDGSRYGEGPTPAAAKAAAGIGGRSVTSRGGAAHCSKCGRRLDAEHECRAGCSQ